MGGVVIGHEVGRALSVRAIFTERVDGVFALRRGFALEAGERVAVVEDVVTTGKSTKEVLDVLRKSGAVPVVCGSIVDRRASRGRRCGQAGRSRRHPVPRPPRARGSRLGPRRVPAVRPGRRRRRARLAASRGRRMSRAPVFILDGPQYHEVRPGARSTFGGIALAIGDDPVAEVVARAGGAEIGRTKRGRRVSRAGLGPARGLFRLPLRARPAGRARDADRPERPVRVRSRSPRVPLRRAVRRTRGGPARGPRGGRRGASRPRRRTSWR